MWIRFVLGGVALAAVMLLFWFQFRLTNKIGRDEDIAAGHLEEREQGVGRR